MDFITPENNNACCLQNVPSFLDTVYAQCIYLAEIFPQWRHLLYMCFGGFPEFVSPLNAEITVLP